MADLILAVDLRGTQLRIALYGPGGTLLTRQPEPTRAEQGVDAVIARLPAPA